MVRLYPTFDNEVTSKVIAKNIAFTRNLTQAKKLLAVQADLARAKSIDLSQAQVLVQSAMLGNASTPAGVPRL